MSSERPLILLIGTEVQFEVDTFGLRPNGGTGVVVGRNFFGDRVQSYIVKEHGEEGYTLAGEIIVPADRLSDNL